jgi:hypothetical protein
MFSFLWDWCSVLLDVLFTEEVDFGEYALLALADTEVCEV